ncbi:MAG: glycine/betaine ABC transporter substrate-binding protein [Chloroflexi bacterium]|nr:glycine/betaine ABC transporter substrate-binding protein [Chloroflexota bacterium]
MKTGVMFPLLLLTLVATVLGSACSGSAPAEKPKIIVGSKDFTEQFIVGNMVASLMAENGYPVEKKIGLGGSALVHEALKKGDINVYVEYTGTGLTVMLKQPVISDPDKAYEAVQKGYKEQFNLVWLKSWGFNNTYALVMRKDQADQLGVKKVSDLSAQSKGMVLGATQEFIVRPDGLPGLATAYGFAFKDAKGMDPGLMYSAVAEKQVDVISGFATDGRIPALNLAVLADDKAYFPPYYAAPIVRQDLLDKSPQVAEILNKLAGKITDQTMASLNAAVDVQKRAPEDVAKEFLKSQGLVK